MSNSEKPPTLLERLASEAEYYEFQAVVCESEIKRRKKRGDDLAVEVERYRKRARETRAAIKTLEDAAKFGKITPLSQDEYFDYAKPAFKPIFTDEGSWIKKPATFDYAKLAFKYDFKVGDRVTHALGDAGYIHSAYTGDNDEYLVSVRHVTRGVEVWSAKNVQPAPKYDFKVGQYVTYVMGENAGYIHSAYTGDNDEYLVSVCHVKRGVELWTAKNVCKN